jgi:hypothetical protein
MSLQSKIHISTHFDDEDQRRQADVVFINNEYYAVDMYEDGELIETRVMKTGDNYHSASYAEDAAENWA